MASIPSLPTFAAGQKLLASQLQLLAAAMAFAQRPPAFSAAQSSPQTISSGSLNILTWPTPAVDSYNGWSAGAPTKYLPQVPGYYDVTATYACAVNATGNRDVIINRNGVAVEQASLPAAAVSDATVLSANAALLFFNGTTDYVEVAVVQRSGSPLATVVGFTSFQAVLVSA